MSEAKKNGLKKLLSHETLDGFQPSNGAEGVPLGGCTKWRTGTGVLLGPPGKNMEVQ